MSRFVFVKRKFITNFWTIAVVTVVAALLSMSFYMLVKAQVLYGFADSLRVARSTLNMTANIFGLIGLVFGIPGVIACLIGNILKKY